VGTRERIIAYLTETGELFDKNGMASTQLAAAVGYPGSSVAFAQLLSGMERSGLIEREVRGKRTYRIGLGQAASAAARNGTGEASRVGGVGEVATPGFDYDELARRLLVQVVRQLAAAEPDGADVADPSAQEAARELAEENVRLREQLKVARRSLALAAERVRRLPVTTGLDSREVMVLQRLLADGAGTPEAGNLAAADLEAADLQDAGSLLS